MILQDSLEAREASTLSTEGENEENMARVLGEMGELGGSEGRPTVGAHRPVQEDPHHKLRCRPTHMRVYLVCRKDSYC